MRFVAVSSCVLFSSVTAAAFEISQSRRHSASDFLVADETFSQPVTVTVGTGRNDEWQRVLSAVLHGKKTASTTRQLAGFGFAAFLIVLLPVAAFFCLRLWFERYENGDLSLQQQDSRNYYATASLIVYVMLLICSDTLTSRTSQAHGGRYPWEPMVVVFLAETLKLVVSLCFGLGERKVAEPIDRAQLPKAFLMLAPVGALYAGNNCLVFFVLSKVDLGSYVVWRNANIFFSAVLWTIVFRRNLRKNQWMGVLFLFCALTLNSVDTNGDLSKAVGYPVLLILANAFASAFAAALNEAVLKKDAFQALGQNVLNCMLYSQTSMLVLLAVIVQAHLTGRPVCGEVVGLLSAVDSSALAIVCLQSCLGLVVSRVLLHADAVAKTMAGGVREIAQVFIAPIFVTSRLDCISVSSVVWVAIAILTYSMPMAKN